MRVYRYLRRLVEFTAKVDGQEQYVKVDSFRRVIDVTTECGSYVLLTTNLGEFKLDTTHLWHNGGKVEVVGAFTKGRKLKALDLEAFYDDVADMEFECKLVWQQEEGACQLHAFVRCSCIGTWCNHTTCNRMQYIILCIATLILFN